MKTSSKSKNRIVSDDEMTNDVSSDEDEEEFQVEKIIGKKVRLGKVSYRIKWKGFPDDEATWEPAENCNCKDLIEEYESLHRQKPFKMETKIESTAEETLPPKEGKDDGAKRIFDLEKFEPPEKIKLPEPEIKEKIAKIKHLRTESLSIIHSSTSVSSPEPVEITETPSLPNEKKSHYVRENASSVDGKATKGDRKSRQDEQILNESSNKKTFSSGSAKKPNVDVAKTGRGFELGYKPRKVLGLIRQGPESCLHMLVAWEDPDRSPEVVSSTIANEKCPALVIQYYEKHLRWKTVQASVYPNEISHPEEPKPKKGKQ